MSLQQSSEWYIFEQRNYQEDGIQNIVKLAKLHMRDALTNWEDLNKLWTMLLVEMATGTGKTFTVASAINKLVALRDRFARIYPGKFLPIDTLVLNNQINLVNQLHSAFFIGEPSKEKEPLLSEQTRAQTSAQVYHSALDDYYASHIVPENTKPLASPEEVGDVKVDTHMTRWRDRMDFVTFQTLGAHPELFDTKRYKLIIIDEAHRLNAEEYFKTTMKYYVADENGRLPLMIAMTATPNKIRHLVGHQAVKYGLTKYLASGISPQIDYRLIANEKVSEEDMHDIHQQLINATSIEDLKERKEAYTLIREQFKKRILSSTRSNHDLVEDFVDRVSDPTWTVIYCRSIDDVDEVVKELNKKSGSDTAVAMHSKTKTSSADILRDYKSGKHKIIVAVNQLNEGIDLPDTNTVVFWRHTESEDLYAQQFGRPLRGGPNKKILYLDYTGSYTNFAKIHHMSNEIETIVKESRQKKESRELDDEESILRIPDEIESSLGDTHEITQPTQESQKRNPLDLRVEIVGENSRVGDALSFSKTHTIDLTTLMQQLAGLERWVSPKSREECIRIIEDMDFNEMIERNRDFIASQKFQNIFWQGIYALGNLFGVMNGKSERQWRQRILKLVRPKEYAEKWAKNKEQAIQIIEEKDFDEMMWRQKKFIASPEFETIFWQKIYALARLFWIEWKEPRQLRRSIVQSIKTERHIEKKDFPKTKEECIAIITNRDLDDMLSRDKGFIESKEFKNIFWRWIYSLATLFGVSGNSISIKRKGILEIVRPQEYVNKTNLREQVTEIITLRDIDNMLSRDKEFITSKEFQDIFWRWIYALGNLFEVDETHPRWMRYSILKIARPQEYANKWLHAKQQVTHIITNRDLNEMLKRETKYIESKEFKNIFWRWIYSLATLFGVSGNSTKQKWLNILKIAKP